MNNYRIKVVDEFENYVDEFVTKAKDHKEALKKVFKRYLKNSFKKDTFGDYQIKININEEGYKKDSPKKYKKYKKYKKGTGEYVIEEKMKISANKPSVTIKDILRVENEM